MRKENLFMKTDKLVQEYMYVLDYCTGSAYKIVMDNEDMITDKDTDDILSKYGLDIDQVSFMFSTNDITEFELLEPIENETN